MTKAMLKTETVRTEMSLDAPEGRMDISAVQRLDGTLAGSAMQLSARGTGLNMRMTLVDEVVYVNLGQQTDGKYARLDLDQPQAAPMLGAETITYEFFLDENELPRRMELDMGPASVELTMSGWGRPVDISAPPRSQIARDDPFADPA